ncbi:hypothetical protein [Halostagnicola kamekurae]|uniref:CHAT domain-containing protein n=1 Tax=Halostagnicola kamekurae TaxID=619731 RepID=A0A1I6QU14_9EURY|nr:hypothetical protein [Halostagnicola kamekurae]SFS55788.1 hypothetical protein SAMN04488556_1546 [Halostagnicola kamekurae]
MLRWDAVDDGLRVTDADNATIVVEGEALEIADSSPGINRPVDETVVVTAEQLRLPHAVVYASNLSSGTQHELDPHGEPLSLAPGEYIVDIDTRIKTYLRFSGAATIHRTDDIETVVVSFPERSRLVLGFRSRHEIPADTITIPDSPSGLASAISHLHVSQKTTSPDRSYPSLRGHPPRIETGQTLEIPSTVTSRATESGITITVPPRYEDLFVVAPLAYYLQASVETSAHEPARLSLEGHDVSVPLPSMPALEGEVEQLLRKVFFLDCLVRNAGPFSTSLSELDVLEALEIDSDRLYAGTIRERLASYLEIPYETIEHRLPDWHLSTYVEAGPDTVETLPFLLDRMSLISMPKWSELCEQELVERSLDDFYRSGTADTRSGGQIPSIDIVKPELQSGCVHGWIADGVPIDVFKSMPEAYQNRLQYLERWSDASSIAVVLNDPEMAGEHESVAKIYRERADALPIELSVEESLTTGELARVFEAEHDFVHFIGHCETDGLCCPDGTFSTSTIETCNAQTFFLNACGSFYEGLELVENGSVAGAVTLQKVLNDHAVKVGSMFATLLVHGFSIERAMDLARRRIMMGKDYAVVGDGTHSLSQGEQQYPTTITMELVDDEQYLLSIECYSTGDTGSYYFPHADGNDNAYLCGSPSRLLLSADELPAFLSEANASVIYDGDVYWSEQLSENLDET